MSRKVVFMACIAFLLVALFAVLLTGNNEERTAVQEKVKVGFVMTGGRAEKGYNQLHYVGIKKATDKLGVDLLVKENVLEFSGECPKAVENFAKQGVKAVFLGSYNYYKEIQPLIDKYPKITFYTISFDGDKPNVASYFVRLYQARYLAGLVAGKQSESGRIGYVAAMPNHEVKRGINAFALGVRAANPQAKVFVRWTGKWDDAVKEKENVRKLFKQQKIDLVAYHQNQQNVVQEAEALGIQSIGYHEPMEGASPKHLTAVVCSWDKTYEYLLQMLLTKQEGKRKEYWVGYPENAVGLTNFSPLVKEETKKLVAEKAQRLKNYDFIFTGNIYDNLGRQRCSGQMSISDKQLVEDMNWLVKGVEVCED